MSTIEGAKRGPYAKTAKRRQEIVEAATSVFAARGYHGGSLRDIARQLELSLTSIVHHFPSKSELLEAVLEHADSAPSEWFREEIETVGLKRAIVDLVLFNYDRPELLRLLAIVSSEASSIDHPAHPWFARRYASLVATFAAAIDEEIRRQRITSIAVSSQVAAIIIAAWDGLQLQWLLDDRFDMAGGMTLVLDTLLPDRIDVRSGA